MYLFIEGCAWIGLNQADIFWIQSITCVETNPTHLTKVKLDWVGFVNYAYIFLCTLKKSYSWIIKAFFFKKKNLLQNKDDHFHSSNNFYELIKLYGLSYYYSYISNKIPFLWFSKKKKSPFYQNNNNNV